MKPESRKVILFLLAAVAAAAVSFGPLYVVVRSGRPPDYYSHIPLVPVVSALVLFRRRKKLVNGASGSFPTGYVVLAIGLGLVTLDLIRSPGLIAHAELRAGGAILILAGAFISLFGTEAFRRALFAFLFLTLAIPLPLAWMEEIVRVLVIASTGFTHLLFRLFQVPFFQEDAIFRLPGFDIVVAEECSGIRSSLALVITSVLGGQLLLDRPWKKIVLALAVFPITVLKNAIRIVTLYLLSYFIDMRIIQGGFLHRSGGFIFFGLGLIMLAYVAWLLMSPKKAYPRAAGRPSVPG